MMKPFSLLLGVFFRLELACHSEGLPEAKLLLLQNALWAHSPRTIVSSALLIRSSADPKCF